MEPEVQIALITAIGSLLGSIITAWASIKVAAIKERSKRRKAEKKPIPEPKSTVRSSVSALRKPRTWLWFVVGAIVGGLLALEIVLAFRGVPIVDREEIVVVPTKVEATATAELPTVTPTVGEETAVPGITYGFEDGTPQGWQAWEREVGLTIQALTVTDIMSFSGQRALQVDVTGLSGSQGATIYLEEVTPTRIFSVKARLPSNARSDVDVWVQLAAAPVIGNFQESEIVYLSPSRWHTIEWDTSSYGWEDGSVRAIYVQLGAGTVEYNGPIYIDEVHVR